MQKQIIDLLDRKGPLTGAEIYKALGGETFVLWKECMLSPQLAIHRVGRRYVRLDRRVEGFARLSPSILREFLTYTVVGLAGDSAAIDQRKQELQSHIVDISRKKLELATNIMIDIATPFTASSEEKAAFCIILAGDIVYEMAHDVNRPEYSTSRMAHGSDLDIVVIVGDDAPDELANQLDNAIYKKKYQYLKHPAFREEIDYVVKRFNKLSEQAEFDTFQRMVACKIFDEAVLLYGNGELFADGKALLSERGVIDKLRAMEQSAILAREEWEQNLLATDEQFLKKEISFLFYTDEESEEFE